MSLPLIVLALGMLPAGLYVRQSIRLRPEPRRVPGESDAETYIMTLAAYRLHSWALWLNVAAWVAGILFKAGEAPLPAGLTVTGAILFLILLATAHRLYWRLGYDNRRWLLLLAYLSPPFWLTEFYTALRSDLNAYLEGHSPEQP